MKVLFFSELSGLGGGETSLLNSLIELKRRNVEVYLMCQDDGKLSKIAKQNNIKVFILPFRKKSKIILNSFKIKKIVKDNNIKILHANDITTAALLKLIFFYNKKIKIFSTCNIQFDIVKGIKKFLLKKINCNFCVSTSVLKNLKNQKINNSVLNYLGTLPNNDKKIDIRKEIGVPENSILIGTVARFQKIKGQLKAIKALNKILKNNDKCYYLLIGDCIFKNDSDIKYKNEVIKYIRENNLEKKVFLLGERKNIKQIMNSIDLLIIPSDNESFGMVAIEAIESNLNVISTPCDGTLEIFENKEEFFSKNITNESLEEKIIEYFENKTTKEKISNEIKKLKGKYLISNTVDCYLKYYNI